MYRKQLSKFVFLFFVIICSLLGIYFNNTEKASTTNFDTSNRNELISTDKTTVYFYLQDSFDSEGNPTISDILTQTESLKTLQLINTALHNNFNYIEITEQPLELFGEYTLPLEFVNGYMSSNKKVNLSNQKIEINGILQTVTPLNALQLDQSAYIHYDLEVATGRNFNEEDFSFSNVIPVILGSKYIDYYNIDDTFELYYIGKKVTVKVIGFLPEKSQISQNKPLCLDHYILMPLFTSISSSDINPNDFLTQNTYDSSDFFIKMLYMQKNTGLIASDSLDSFDSINQELQNISKLYGFHYYLVNPYAS